MMSNLLGRTGSIRDFFARRKRVRRFLDLDRCINSLVTDGAGPESSEHASELFRAWGDPLDEGRENYIQSCLAEYQASQGSVLITGASALTLTLGAISSGDDRRAIWCFDEDPHWSRVLRSWLAQYGIKHTFLITTAPVLIRNMIRYRIDARRLPADFGLVLCEGSMGSVKNPFSVLVHFGNHFAASFTLLARNVNVDQDAPLLRRWAKRHNATFELVSRQEGIIKLSRTADSLSQITEKVTFLAAEVPDTTKASADPVPGFATAGV